MNSDLIQYMKDNKYTYCIEAGVASIGYGFKIVDTTKTKTTTEQNYFKSNSQSYVLLFTILIVRYLFLVLL